MIDRCSTDWDPLQALPVHDSRFMTPRTRPVTPQTVFPAAIGRKATAGKSELDRKVLEILYKSDRPDTSGQGNPSASGAHPVSELLFRYGAFASR